MPQERYFVLTVIVLLLLLSGCNKNTKNLSECEIYDSLDLKMLQTYDSIEKKYEGNKEFLKRLVLAQVDWIQYRDTHIRLLWPLKKENYDNYVECKCKVLNEFTRIRIEQLQVWIKEEEMFDCPSSIGSSD